MVCWIAVTVLVTCTVPWWHFQFVFFTFYASIGISNCYQEYKFSAGVFQRKMLLRTFRQSLPGKIWRQHYLRRNEILSTLHYCAPCQACTSINGNVYSTKFNTCSFITWNAYISVSHSVTSYQGQ